MRFISINMALLLKIVHIHVYTVIHVCAIVTNLTLRSATDHALHIIISHIILAGKNTIVILWYVHSVFVDSGEAFCSD